MPNSIGLAGSLAAILVVGSSGCRVQGAGESGPTPFSTSPADLTTALASRPAVELTFGTAVDQNPNETIAAAIDGMELFKASDHTAVGYLVDRSRFDAYWSAVGGGDELRPVAVVSPTLDLSSGIYELRFGSGLLDRLVPSATYPLHTFEDGRHGIRIGVGYMPTVSRIRFCKERGYIEIAFSEDTKIAPLIPFEESVSVFDNAGEKLPCPEGTESTTQIFPRVSEGQLSATWYAKCASMTDSMKIALRNVGNTEGTAVAELGQSGPFERSFNLSELPLVDGCRLWAQ